MKLTSFPSYVSTPSPDGNLLLTFNDGLLKVSRISHSASELSTIRQITQANDGAKVPILRWAPISHCTGEPTRFLFATETTVKVFDLKDEEWSATIKAPQDVHTVHFGEHDDEVFLYDSFKTVLSVYNLYTGQRVDIKNPKAIGAGSGRHRHFVFLSRQDSQDIVSIHTPYTYEVCASFCPQTVDAQGLKLSPDGKWIAVWEAASMGYKVLIYTIDGYLYRSFKEDYFEDDLQGLGVKSVEWSPNGDFLAVGSFHGLVKLLSTKKCTTAAHLAHRNVLSPGKAAVYLENVKSNGPVGRSYTLANTAVHLPNKEKAAASTPFGVSEMRFNADGTLLATKYEAFPSTVWIWDLATLSPRAVLVQHSGVQEFSWHSHNQDWLIINSDMGGAVAHVWDGNRNSSDAPSVIDMESHGYTNNKSKVSFVRCFRYGREFVALFHEKHDGSSSIMWPFERPQYSPQLGAVEDTEPTHDLPLGDATLHDDFHTLNGTIQDDTFAFRRGVSAY